MKDGLVRLLVVIVLCEKTVISKTHFFVCLSVCRFQLVMCRKNNSLACGTNLLKFATGFAITLKTPQKRPPLRKTPS